jgi:hypothetical protein
MNMILPERRRERRYVTLKNAGIAGIALVVAFLLLTAWSAFRPHSNAEGFFASRGQSSDSTSIRHDPMVVREGSVDDHPGTDSMLLDPGAEDQLQAPVAPAAPPAAPPALSTAVVQQPSFEPRTSQLGKGRQITISQGTDGVQVHAEPMPGPAKTTQPPQQ